MTRSDSTNIAASKPDATDERGDERRQRDEEATYQIQGGESVTEAIVRAVSSETRTDEARLESLYSAVDTDALNAIFSPFENGVSRQANTTVTFDYCGHRVKVTSENSIEIV